MNNLSRQLQLAAGGNRCRLMRRGVLPIALSLKPASQRSLATHDRSTTAEGSHAGRDWARRSRLEAVLFIAREPLSLRKLAQLSNLTDGTEARTLLNALRKGYDDRGSAFQVAQLAGGYQLLSRPEFAAWLRPHFGRERSIRLSPPALETLAVVAYRQPVLRAEVEAIRGVACGELLRQLMDRDLLRIAGRSEELGRPLAYGTTKRFLQVFGLNSLGELPWATQLRCPEKALDVDSANQAADRGAHLTDGVEAA